LLVDYWHFCLSSPSPSTAPHFAYCSIQFVSCVSLLVQLSLPDSRLWSQLACRSWHLGKTSTIFGICWPSTWYVHRHNLHLVAPACSRTHGHLFPPRLKKRQRLSDSSRK
jgi:hypothetical protein